MRKDSTCKGPEAARHLRRGIVECGLRSGADVGANRAFFVGHTEGLRLHSGHGEPQKGLYRGTAPQWRMDPALAPGEAVEKLGGCPGDHMG